MVFTLDVVSDASLLLIQAWEWHYIPVLCILVASLVPSDQPLHTGVQLFNGSNIIMLGIPGA